jgi:hypothetical protein
MIGRAATSVGRSVLLLVFTASLSACKAELENPSSGSEPSGQVSLALQVAPGVEVSEVHYAITRDDGYRQEGSIPLSAGGNAFSGLFVLPAAIGYALALQATTTTGPVCSARQPSRSGSVAEHPAA